MMTGTSPATDISRSKSHTTNVMAWRARLGRCHGHRSRNQFLLHSVNLLDKISLLIRARALSGPPENANYWRRGDTSWPRSGPSIRNQRLKLRYAPGIQPPVRSAGEQVLGVEDGLGLIQPVDQLRSTLTVGLGQTDHRVEIRR